MIRATQICKDKQTQWFQNGISFHKVTVKNQKVKTLYYLLRWTTQKISVVVQNFVEKDQN